SWTSTIYTFYLGDVKIEYRGSKLHHTFTCGARNCKHTITRNQTTKDSNSTKNLRVHAKKCWGEDNVVAAEKVKSLAAARKLLKENSGVRSQRLTDIFRAHEAGGGESFSHVPLTNEQSRMFDGSPRASESLRPFVIVKDRAYRRLMKSGRTSAYIPSPTTIARDVKLLFNKTRERLKKRFQNTPACISLVTDAWTSPNHRAYIAVSGHWEEEGKQINCLLDFVDVPKVILSQLNRHDTHQSFSHIMARILRRSLRRSQKTSALTGNSPASPATMPPPTTRWFMPSRPDFLPSTRPRIAPAALLTLLTLLPKVC
ncbi:hypothetical protein B0H10DRAFT_1831741, partial [Mycena sp. CBHHK59/15]